MNSVPSTVLDWTGQLLASESSRAESHATTAHPSSRVSDRLRVPLSRLAGEAGFRSLLARALFLANAQDASLNAVHIGPNGSLIGFDGGNPAHGAEVVAQLIGLLVTFIGTSLTRQLVREVWPDGVTGEMDGSSGALA